MSPSLLSFSYNRFPSFNSIKYSSTILYFLQLFSSSLPKYFWSLSFTNVIPVPVYHPFSKFYFYTEYVSTNICYYGPLFQLLVIVIDPISPLSFFVQIICNNPSKCARYVAPETNKCGVTEELFISDTLIVLNVSFFRNRIQNYQCYAIWTVQFKEMTNFPPLIWSHLFHSDPTRT